MVGHYDLLLQVFTNLVGNSLKFTEAGGKVAMRAYLVTEGHANSTVNGKPSPFLTPPPDTLDTGNSASDSEMSDKFVRVEIADTGIGIDLEDQEAIFDRFFRVENRVHTLEGTGLGLSIVRNIVEKHHSRVHLVSEVSKGTTFWFDLKVFQETPLLTRQT